MASSSRGAQAQVDSFIDDDDLTCPLCVEEFDLSDRNFRPCPCGYQVCQFCFNNIKNNMNGLCPACRRPYDEKTIEWKVVTQEEIAEFKANVQKNAKKKAEQRHKELQKREAENQNRKHLAGLRVVQKNLVYVVGLTPALPGDELLKTLRTDKYFGQYGKILKIVVSKGKEGASQNHPSLGVYITFESKEDAKKCIDAVNGIQNGNQTIRAQLGTTKYCSSYLRNENCTNKSCMFLHEPGDDDDSYSRQDLSSINSVNTQRPLPTARQPAARQSNQAPIQQAQPVAAASQPMTRDLSREGSDGGDNSALPSSVNWANRGTQQRSRRGSQATSGAASSPGITMATPAPTHAAEEPSSTVDDSQVENVMSSNPVPETPPRKEPSLPLDGILKAITSPNFAFHPAPLDSEMQRYISNFPPLFDDNGGARRRALRNRQEEARLHIEQESQNDLRSILETNDEEEPESGSLQLGGEPEERDESHLLSQGLYDQRRPSAQLPIQRGSNEAVFGSAIGRGFPQNTGNPNAATQRTMTPTNQHHLLSLKSGQAGQSSFLDQFPAGMGGGLTQSAAQSALYQHGHNRQSSRYSFANDSASATASLKPAANSKLMAQQSSMMPPQGNQFYGSSMPGPPPGLKSTGTPPINAGGMFGQGQGFGNSLAGNSAFGSAAKDNTSDMLRDMLRGRGSGGIGTGQGHEAGKRESMFPSFLNQYPSTSSTPAPASGFLASLYGPQPGAFQDFGPKQQKKKGKKHRHANTSSSGGGGLVDLADPSILQARIQQQQQQQSNAGVGQGLFSGQAQDEQALPSIDEVSNSVDNLVADAAGDVFPSRVTEAQLDIPRTSTPSVPPGLGLSHAHPPAITRAESTTRLPSRIVPTSAPFTPSRNPSSTHVPRVATPLAVPSAPSTPKQAAATIKPAVPAVTLPRTETSKVSTEAGSSKDVEETTISQTKANTKPPTVETEEGRMPEPKRANSPSVDVKNVSPRAPVVPTTIPTKLSADVTAPTKIESAAETVSEPAQPGKPMPEPLNIANTASSHPEIAPQTEAAPAISEKSSSAASSAFPPLPTASTSAQSAVTRIGPKTLRVVPAAKPEASITTPTPSSATSVAPPPGFPPSRQPSLTSNSRFERPHTPASENISDNASITSTSLSRANSPPPAAKVGSAPVRATTKSQQKKQRREAQKEKEKTELEAIPNKTEVEVEIAPIIGRKKKQKKEKPASRAASGVSRPVSPGPLEQVKEEPKAKDKPSQEKETPKAVTLPEETALDTPNNDTLKAKEKDKEKVEEVLELYPRIATVEDVEEPIERPAPNPAAVLQELVENVEIPELEYLSIFKYPVITNYRSEHPVDPKDPDDKMIITEEDRQTLQSGLPVHKILRGGHRVMLTPNGDCVRNLTDDEEQRYLELQIRIAQDHGSTAFTSSRHDAGEGFTLISGRAVPNGPAASFPSALISTSFDPVSKIQRDEALNYINQCVLPSLSTTSQLEKALSANADRLEAEIRRSGESSNWAGWNTHSIGSGSGAPAVAEGADQASPGPVDLPANNSNKSGGGFDGLPANLAVMAAGRRGQQPLSNVTLLGLADAESAMLAAKKETEKLEKSLNQLLKKNRRVVLGSSS